MFSYFALKMFFLFLFVILIIILISFSQKQGGGLVDGPISMSECVLTVEYDGINFMNISILNKSEKKKLKKILKQEKKTYSKKYRHFYKSTLEMLHYHFETDIYNTNLEDFEERVNKFNECTESKDEKLLEYIKTGIKLDSLKIKKSFLKILVALISASTEEKADFYFIDFGGEQPANIDKTVFCDKVLINGPNYIKILQLCDKQVFLLGEYHRNLTASDNFPFDFLEFIDEQYGKNIILVLEQEPEKKTCKLIKKCKRDFEKKPMEQCLEKFRCYIPKYTTKIETDIRGFLDASMINWYLNLSVEQRNLLKSTTDIDASINKIAKIRKKIINILLFSINMNEDLENLCQKYDIKKFETIPVKYYEYIYKINIDKDYARIFKAFLNKSNFLKNDNQKVAGRMLKRDKENAEADKFEDFFSEIMDFTSLFEICKAKKNVIYYSGSFHSWVAFRFLNILGYREKYSFVNNTKKNYGILDPDILKDFLAIQKKQEPLIDICSIF